MAHPIPTSEPASLRVGDTWAWSRADLTNYPASTWTLTYHFRNADDFFDVIASADGEAFSISVPAATTAAYTAGSYTWTALVFDGTDRHEVGNGVVNVLADVSVAAAFDGRSLPRRLLDAVNAILESRASADQIDLVNAAAGDQSFARNTAGLIEYKSKLELEVKREEGSGGMKRIVARFGHA